MRNGDDGPVPQKKEKKNGMERVEGGRPLCQNRGVEGTGPMGRALNFLFKKKTKRRLGELFLLGLRRNNGVGSEKFQQCGVVGNRIR